jgi:hypothetical protein
MRCHGRSTASARGNCDIQFVCAEAIGHAITNRRSDPALPLVWHNSCSQIDDRSGLMERNYG